MNLPEVAKWQKILLFIVLAWIILIVASVALAATGNLNTPAPAGTPPSPTALSLVLNVVSLILAIGAIVSVILIGGALGWGVLPRVICALLMFCPIVNIITLLVIITKATAALKAGGYKVGLMGAQGPPA